MSECYPITVIGCDELAKLRARAADAEREAAQEKARNAELAEQLRVAREATREAVARAEGAEAERTAAEREAAELMASWHSARDQHLADVGTLSRCLEARDKRVAELEDRLRHPAEITVPAGYVDESWVREQWDRAQCEAQNCVALEFPLSLRTTPTAKMHRLRIVQRGFARRMGWRT